MLACTVHGPGDLRLEQRPIANMAPDQVRVRLGAGGICGTDLHYWHEGGIGDFPVRDALVLGHEMAGVVEEVGPAVTGLAEGQKVAVNPTLACGVCLRCTTGDGHLCPEVRFAGSSRSWPHVQGYFQESVVVAGRQCRPIPLAMDLGVAAMAEPTAVSLHAVGRAGPLLGRKVLVAGAGPIGCLIVLCARLAGAAEVVATDLVPACLAKAREVGADDAIDVANEAGKLAALAGEERFDVVFECAGAPRSLEAALGLVKRGGTVVQVGIMPRGSHPVPLDKLVAREVALLGTFRFWEEYDRGLDLLARGRLDVRPLITEQLPLAQAIEAFALADDKRRAMKVQLVP